MGIFGYDAPPKLAGAFPVFAGGSSSRASSGYDALARRQRRRRRGTPGQGAAAWSKRDALAHRSRRAPGFVYDGARGGACRSDTRRESASSYAYDESGGSAPAIISTYVYLDGDLVSMEDTRAGNANEGRYWVLKDRQSSVRMVLDDAAAVVASYDYSAFGEILDATSFEPTDWIFPHRAFGEVLDPNLGWTYLRARWMDPEVGRFVSRDPFGGKATQPISLHRYFYAMASPSMYADPSGYYGIKEGVAVTSGIQSIAGAEKGGFYWEESQ